MTSFSSLKSMYRAASRYVLFLMPFYGSKLLYYRTISSLTPSPDLVYNARKIRLSTYLIARKTVDYLGHER